MTNKLKQIKEGTIGDIAQIILDESLVFGAMVIDSFFDTPEFKERAKELYHIAIHSDVYKHKIKKLIIEDLVKEISGEE